MRAMTAVQSDRLYISCKRAAVEVVTPDQEGDRVGRVITLCLHLASKFGMNRVAATLPVNV